MRLAESLLALYGGYSLIRDLAHPFVTRWRRNRIVPLARQAGVLGKTVHRGDERGMP